MEAAAVNKQMIEKQLTVSFWADQQFGVSHSMYVLDLLLLVSWISMTPLLSFSGLWLTEKCNETVHLCDGEYYSLDGHTNACCIFYITNLRAQAGNY